MIHIPLFNLWVEQIYTFSYFLKDCVHVTFCFSSYSVALGKKKKKIISFILFSLPSYCQTETLMINNKFKTSIYIK